jgi:hypothetical protein
MAERKRGIVKEISVIEVSYGLETKRNSFCKGVVGKVPTAES